MKRHRKTIVLIAVCIALVAALALTVIGQSKINAAEDFNRAQTSKEAQLPSVAVPDGVTSSSSPQASPAQPTKPTESVSSEIPAPVVSTPVIQEVAPAAPESLTVRTELGDLDLTVKVDPMPYNDGLTAPSCTDNPDSECPEKAFWVQDTMGVAPASSTDNSTYIVGHSWTTSPRVFDQLSNYVMTHYETAEKGSKECDIDMPIEGDRCPKVTFMPSVYDPSGESRSIVTWQVPSLVSARITLRTANGVLTYRVVTAFVAKKVDIGFIHAFQRGDPNTVTLQTCGVDLTNKVDTEFGIVVIGTLESAVANS
ncbi:MAG: hypothetical protein WBP12_00380 [Candidatus Saccharimonas sp.]